MICITCNGTGNLYICKEFWDCPACGGDGSRVVYGPAVIGRKSRQMTHSQMREMKADDFKE